VYHFDLLSFPTRRSSDLGIEKFLVAQKLMGVIGMRLVPKVCPNCVEEYSPEPNLLLTAGLTPAEVPFRRGSGCDQCLNRGWRGRSEEHTSELQSLAYLVC